MISTEEFLARVDQANEARHKAHDRHEELYKELQALAVLTGCTVSRSGSFPGKEWVTVYGPDGAPVMTSELGDVVETLAAPPPDDAPFSIFTTVRSHPWLPGPSGPGPFIFRFPVASPAAAAAQDAPVHIERRDFTLISELAESLSDYLDELA